MDAAVPVIAQSHLLNSWCIGCAARFGTSCEIIALNAPVVVIIALKVAIFPVKKFGNCYTYKQ